MRIVGALHPYLQRVRKRQRLGRKRRAKKRMAKSRSLRWTKPRWRNQKFAAPLVALSLEYVHQRLQPCQKVPPISDPAVRLGLATFTTLFIFCHLSPCFTLLPVVGSRSSAPNMWEWMLIVRKPMFESPTASARLDYRAEIEFDSDQPKL
ncbi:hypothetical protein PHSY_000749 [Pseudozyma hubeiensis SY62]|uniref:Uncharacterized protein n=1 Tax=Pseudozyma hubeiensis (strain SY62) TaxID=1305764 RepID=R9NX92_PSEHS|nr:hypothetical protein PHSY_000749 [Pseudozyma hubeiensis SY62]GAC93186.1 hypothetical protein PHSY_000749 [Pseudozyma hubeiensis SY62]